MTIEEINKNLDDIFYILCYLNDFPNSEEQEKFLETINVVQGMVNGTTDIPYEEAAKKVFFCNAKP